MQTVVFRKYFLEDIFKRKFKLKFQSSPVSCRDLSFCQRLRSSVVTKRRNHYMAMGAPSKPPYWTYLTFCFLFLAMLCWTCYNTISQERLLAEVSELKSQLQIMKVEIYEGIPRKLKQHSRETDPLFQNIAMPEGNNVGKFDWFNSGNF